MSARSRLLLDLGAFVALVVAFNPTWTGLPVHEWLSVAIVLPLLLHLIVNWEQTLRFLDTFATKLRNKSRLDLVVDVALFFTTTAVMLSGLMISKSITPALGLTPTPGAIWTAVHSVMADLTIALLLAHFTLHWQWVLAVGRRLFASRNSSARKPRRSLGGKTVPVLVATAFTAFAIFSAVTAADWASGGSTAIASTSAYSATGTATSSGQQVLTCPRTGCTATYCHATQR